MGFKRKYTIKDLETLSGIKAHTIRIWEKRYQIFTPDRTDTNIRSYSNDDLMVLLNISLLKRHGYKISKIIAMSASEVADLLLGISLVQSEPDDLVGGMIASMIALDERQFHKVFAAGIFKMGFEKAITDVVFRFFDRIGLMWQAGSINPAQEHFASHLVRQKLNAAIDSLPNSADERSIKVLLFLPGQELHELSLLFFNYALRSRGFDTVYLGQAVPIDTLSRVVEISNPDYLLCTVTTPIQTDEFKEILSGIQESFEGKVLISGGALQHHSPDCFPNNVTRFDQLSDLLETLKQ